MLLKALQTFSLNPILIDKILALVDYKKLLRLQFMESQNHSKIAVYLGADGISYEPYTGLPLGQFSELIGVVTCDEGDWLWEGYLAERNDDGKIKVMNPSPEEYPFTAGDIIEWPDLMNIMLKAHSFLPGQFAEDLSQPLQDLKLDLRKCLLDRYRVQINDYVPNGLGQTIQAELRKAQYKRIADATR